MNTRMVIDARHPEETRVAVLTGNRIEEFDFDSADHKQIKGNIYLAKVTRVEPSLQAAFVDFGGNRHGFLAFSEIHPDYYQIPKEDREALLAEEAAHAAEEAALRAVEEAEEDAIADSEGYADDAYAPAPGDHHDGDDDRDGDDDQDGDGAADEDRDEHGGVTEIDRPEPGAVIEDGEIDGDDDDFDSSADEAEAGETGQSHGEDTGQGRRRGRRQGSGSQSSDRGRSQAKDTQHQADDLRARRMALRRRYKIQDVIHRRQVLLVQVVKEERGNKGAALTSYLSLAGRYCVLMPNSSHGGGISRKINSVADRKRLKSIISEMALPKSMGCIVRTAGLQRTKTEIKRDFDYLARLWDEIRDTTLHSSAPALIHSDSDLIKRAIRDIYNRDIEEVIVEGEAGYRLARDFMKLLMPTHARRVKAYVDPVPLFQRFGAEDQLTAMYDPVVQLKSGGYIVINPTEALVSIDINSGRSTKEHGIEATAVNTNLEAAREIARQLRLRDMAGLIVIDFIDMEYGSNVRKVEKAMKDALRDDRARIQIGRISSFGLMEMSRQRLRTGVLEATTRSCPHCDGSGLVRTAGSAGLSALRMIEEEAAKGRGIVITLFASQEAAIYVLNTKRTDLAEIEARYGVTVEVIPEGENEGAKMRVASSGPRNEFVPKFEPIAYIEEDDDDLPEEEDEDAVSEDAISDDDVADDPSSLQPRRTRESAAASDGERSAERAPDGADVRRKRRKRRRGRGRDSGDEQAAGGETITEPTLGDGEPLPDASDDTTAQAGAIDEVDTAIGFSEAHDGSDDGEAQANRRRRGRRRRGGRNRSEPETGEAGGEPSLEDAAQDSAAPLERQPEPGSGVDSAQPGAGDTVPLLVEAAEAPVGDVTEAPAPKPRGRRKKADADMAQAISGTDEAVAAEVAAPAEKPKRGRRKKADAGEVAEPAVDAATDTEAASASKRPRRKKADAALPEEAAVAASADEQPPLAPRPAADLVEADSSEPQPSAANADSEDPTGEPRRGWWQRTFGA